MEVLGIFQAGGDVVRAGRHIRREPEQAGGVSVAAAPLHLELDEVFVGFNQLVRHRQQMLAEAGDGLDAADFLAIDHHLDLDICGLLQALGEPDGKRSDGRALGARVGEAEATMGLKQRLGGGGGGFAGRQGFGHG